MMRYAAFLAVIVAGCSTGNLPSPPVAAESPNSSDFPLGQPGAAGAETPFVYPTAQSSAAINLLPNLVPVALAATSGCSGCSGMTMTITDASYPGYGKSFNGTYNFVRIGNDPNTCQFEAENAWNWRFILRPSSVYGGWELIGQQFSGFQVIYHTPTDPSNGGTGWTGTSFSLVYSYTGTGVPQSVSVN